MEMIMLHASSSSEDVVMQLRQMLPANTATAPAPAINRHELWKRIAMNTIGDHYVESVDALVRLDEARELLAPYGARRFKDVRCPICGAFGCGSC